MRHAPNVPAKAASAGERGYIGFDIIANKPLMWLGDSLELVRRFATEARKEIGFELWEVQQGKEPSNCKPMAPIGIGVQESENGDDREAQANSR